MDWHLVDRPEWYKDGKKLFDQSGETFGWTGFTWNKRFSPIRKIFLITLKS